MRTAHRLLETRPNKIPRVRGTCRSPRWIPSTWRGWIPASCGALSLSPPPTDDGAGALMAAMSSLVRPRLLLSIWSYQSLKSLSVSPQFGSSTRLHGGMAGVCLSTVILGVNKLEGTMMAFRKGACSRRQKINQAPGRYCGLRSTNQSNVSGKSIAPDSCIRG